MAIVSVAQRHKTAPPYAGAPAQLDLRPANSVRSARGVASDQGSPMAERLGQRG